MWTDTRFLCALTVLIFGSGFVVLFAMWPAERPTPLHVVKSIQVPTLVPKPQLVRE